MIYIGGNEQTFEFDFGTKIAGSTKECPLRLFISTSKDIHNVKTQVDMEHHSQGFALWENGKQYFMDKLSKQDNLVEPLSTGYNSTPCHAQVMVELDLNHLANDLFGGSHDALKNAIKTIEIGTWAYGSGSNNGKKENGIIVSLYRGNTDTWWKWDGGGYDVCGEINTASPSLRILKTTAGYSITKDNKFYILVYSKYPSDAKIPSTVYLDYLNIKITLKREPDRIKSIPINLEDKGSILVRFSPDFSCNNLYHSIFDLNDGTWDNRLVCHFGRTSDSGLALYLAKNKTTQWRLHCNADYGDFYTDEAPYKPYGLVSLILSWDKQARKASRLVRYDGKSNYYETAINDMLSGKFELILGGLVDRNEDALNGFIEDFQYMPDKTFSEEEMESILKGEHKYFERPNLAKLSDFTTNYSALSLDLKFINNKLILTNKQDGWSNVQSIKYKVLPNNTYKFKASGGTGKFAGAPHVYLISSKGSILNNKLEDMQLHESGIFKTNEDTTEVQFTLYPGYKKGSQEIFEDVELRLIP